MKEILFEIRCNLFDVIIAILLCVGILLVGMILGATNERRTASDNTVVQIEKEVEYRTAPQYKTLEIVREIEPQPETLLKNSEKELIAQVVYAEAAWEDMIGKRLVVDTILNRVGREGFADTVSGVVYQPHQYVIATQYNEECMQAVELECMERLDYNVIWFCNSGYMPYGVPAYQHGNHWFNWISNDWKSEDIPMGAGAQEVFD